MKVTEEKQRDLCSWSNRVDGRVQFWFSKKELPLVFRKIDDYINILKERYPQHELKYTFSWHYSSADLFWERPLTNEEKVNVKKLKSEERVLRKQRELAYAKKLAKKHKLI